MTLLDAPALDCADSDFTVTWSDRISLAESPEPVAAAKPGEPFSGPAALSALCEAAVERHLGTLTAPLAGLSEQQLRRLRPDSPFDQLPPAVSDRLTARLLRRRPTTVDLPLLYALTSPRQTAVRLAGKAAGCRARAVALQLRAPRLQLLLCDISCDCNGADTCDGYEAVLRLAADSAELRVFVDSSGHRAAGAALHRLLTRCPKLQQLAVRQDGTAQLRGALTGHVFPELRQLALECPRSGCWDVVTLSRLFPGLRQLSLTGPDPDDFSSPGRQRCRCRYAVGAPLACLETARLRRVCSTLVDAVRAGAPRLHSLQLVGCSLSLSERGCARRRSLRQLVCVVLRRPADSLGGGTAGRSVRRLEISDRQLDAALINHRFPCLRMLAVRCATLTEAPPPAGEPQLWFPCLQRLSVQLTGSGDGDGWDAPAILQRPLPRLTDYQQSFGCASLRRLAASCPRLERLRLDPVLLAPPEDEEPPSLAALRQLTVGWCDNRALAEMARHMPALQRVTVLDPPSVDKQRWAQLEVQLAQRGVQLTLQW